VPLRRLRNRVCPRQAKTSLNSHLWLQKQCLQIKKDDEFLQLFVLFLSGGNVLYLISKNVLKGTTHKHRIFFIRCVSNGISSRRSRVYHQGRGNALVSHHAQVCMRFYIRQTFLNKQNCARAARAFRKMLRFNEKRRPHGAEKRSFSFPRGG